MAYNIDHTKTSLSYELLSKNVNNIFFETGTNTGKAIEVALKCGFKKIISVDIEKYYVDMAKNKFTSEKFDGIEFDFYLGDSKDVIGNVLPNIKEKITFWLDGHSMFSVPLVEELDLIYKHSIKDHTIIIDDVNMFGSPEWNYLKESDIIDRIKSINQKYEISYHDSVYGKNCVLLASVNE